MFLSSKHRPSGFTLIELLVVIAIIGLLSTLAVVALNGVRAKARDTVRKDTLKQLQTSLELYAADNNAYPSTGGAWYSSEPGDAVGDNGGNYIPGLAPTYIHVLPRDPRGGASSLCAGWKSAFLYSSNGANYKLLSHCAPEGTWTAADPFYDPPRPTWAWKICSEEPACSTW